MSRYDYRDPGTDAAYCDGLEHEDDPIDDETPADANALQRDGTLTRLGDFATASLGALHAALLAILARRGVAPNVEEVR